MIFTLPSRPGASSLRTVGRWPHGCPVRWLHHWRLDNRSSLARLRFLTSAPESAPLVNRSPSARAGRFRTGCRRLIRWQISGLLRRDRSRARFPRMNGVRKGHRTVRNDTVLPIWIEHATSFVLASQTQEGTDFAKFRQ